MCKHIFYWGFFDQQMGNTRKNLQVAIYNVPFFSFMFWRLYGWSYNSDSLKTKDKSFKQGLMDNILILVVFCC